MKSSSTSQLLQDWITSRQAFRSGLSIPHSLLTLLQFEKRVSEKRKQLVDSLVVAPVATAPSPLPEAQDPNDDSSAASSSDDTEHAAKKVKFDPKRS
jgi:hypothetical protein